jgi:hypothetical protein
MSTTETPQTVTLDADAFTRILDILALDHRAPGDTGRALALLTNAGVSARVIATRGWPTALLTLAREALIAATSPPQPISISDDEYDAMVAEAQCRPPDHPLSED